MHLLDIEPSSVDRARPTLNLESKLQDLILYTYEIDVDQLGTRLSRTLEENPFLPGVVLRKNGNFLGMLSRRRVLEILSRPYRPELFLSRPIQHLYDHARIETLILSAETRIVDAVQASLDRSPELLYEPIVVRFEHKHEQLLDVHHLLLAHTRIQELTTKLLHEQTQAKLLQTEKMASLGEMVAGVAHEILNPVNFICGNLEYLSTYGTDLIKVLQAYETEFPQTSPAIAALKEDLQMDFLLEDFPRILASLNIGSDRLRKIILALRNFSHMDEEIKRPLDLHESLDNTLLILNNRIKNFVSINKDYGELPSIHCFSGQLSQVFTNLIANAIDALAERSESNTDPTWAPQITIATKLLPRSPSDFSDRVLISIGDNGCGIPIQIQNKIFETFFTTKPVGKGTGFGLAIARQIVVEKHQGELTLQSELDVGTTFTVTLPVR